MNNINKSNKYYIYPEIGDRFNYLIMTSEPFIKRFEESKRNMGYAEFKCDCGSVKILPLVRVKRGDIKSCGCKRIKYNQDLVYHGDSKSKLYHIWASMKQRCLNKKCNQFYLYGGKGIRIFKDWLIYENFKKWSLKNGYKEGLSIDRIDSSKNYCPENCEWVTRKENSSRVTSSRDKQIMSLTKQNIQLKNRILELEKLMFDKNIPIP